VYTLVGRVNLRWRVSRRLLVPCLEGKIQAIRRGHQGPGYTAAARERGPTQLRYGTLE
jgi:hypothetical protein